MRALPFLILLWMAAFTARGAEPGDGAKTSRIQSFTGGWGKGPGAAHCIPVSRLDRLGGEQKSAELPVPLTATRVSAGPLFVEGLPGMENRLLMVRVTNPNSFPIFFRGRQFKEQTTIKQIWRRVSEGKRSEIMAFDSCDTGVRDLVIPAAGALDIMLVRAEKMEPNQIWARFYREDDPMVFSECLLYDPAGEDPPGSH